MSTIIEGLLGGLAAFNRVNAFYIMTDVYAIFASQPRFGGLTAFLQPLAFYLLGDDYATLASLF